MAILSDIALWEKWEGMYQLEEEEAPVDSGPFLQAGMNILMYVLSREDGLTPVRPRPAWEITRPRVAAQEEAPIEVVSRLAAEETASLDRMADLDGSLALLQSPLGAAVADGGLVIRLGGRYNISLLRGGVNGILLHNIPRRQPLGRDRVRRAEAGNRRGRRGWSGDRR